METSAISTSSYMCSVFIDMTYNKIGAIEEVLWCEVSKWSYLSDHTDFKFQNQIVTENRQRSVQGVASGQQREEGLHAPLTPHVRAAALRGSEGAGRGGAERLHRHPPGSFWTWNSVIVY